MSLKNMQVYCTECRKTSWIEIDTEELRKENNTLNVPSPSSNSGIIIQSISHGDHVLIVEIDNNNQVRKESVVHLISSVIENIVAETVEYILLSPSFHQGQIRNIVYNSQSKAFRDFFKSVLSILVLNLDGDQKFEGIVENNLIEIHFNNLSLLLISELAANIHEDIHTLLIDLENFKLPSKNLDSLIARQKQIEIILAYNSKRHGNTPTDLFNYLLNKGLTNISLYDYSSANGLRNIIETSFFQGHKPT